VTAHGVTLPVRRRAPGPAPAGFSMIELLVAMLILSTALLGVARLTVGVMEGNRASRHHGVATLLAQDRIESLKGLAGGSPVTATEDYGTIPGFPPYRRVTDVRPDTPEAGLSTVTVTVHWRRDARSAVLRTILAR